ncbi:protein-glutamate methylesterase/protein-glutamine glutaminase [Cohnella fermenti]|uniref:Protein-glutamate methylesterase/protein-glutamine glutaminase n=1 Tax=Cohnella fermenti TaxID=2565925 RepID=A0A4V3WFR1_9BACL|nr:chemotaxis response regulator protein-glutamate methylesterase [Cohnella fermenti]THF81247.1 chemotaxis response regulator protein-glutamate methylesterase [Cohnella fermenti]
MTRFKVLVVDDSPFMRKVFSDSISADPTFEVAATASNGLEAIEKTLAIEPDVITMDLEMPTMNGLEALRRIMSVKPTPVIMLSAVTDNGTRDTIRALQYGALDFIRKPDGSVKLDIKQVGDMLREKLHVAIELAKRDNVHLLAAADDYPEPDEVLHVAAEEEAAAASQEPPPPEPGLPAADMRKKWESPQLPAAPPAKPPENPGAEAAQAKRSGRAAWAPDGRRTKGGLPGIDEPAGDPRSGKRASPKDKTSSRGKPAVDLPQGRAKPASRLESVHSPPELPRAAHEPEAESGGRKQVSGDKAPGSPKFGHIVAIGTSTGGPRALQEVLTSIPPDFPAPILIVQHMPPKFTHSLAQRLNSFSNIHVREAVQGERVLSGTAYIAPGGLHMTLVREAAGSYHIALSDDAQVSGHRPSVDRMFESLLGMKELKRHIVLMTGMGSDGARAMMALQEDGADTLIAESEQTCVVYGMPRSAVELGAVSQVLNLQQIAPAIVYEVTARRR